MKEENHIGNVTIFSTNAAGHVFGRISVDDKRANWKAWESLCAWHVRIYIGRILVNNREAEQAVREKLHSLKHEVEIA